MKNIIVGNGINIEFGGARYLNSGIISRLLNNLQTKDYSDIFAQKITSKELLVVFKGLHNELVDILNGKHNDYCQTAEEKSTLERVKKQYPKISSISDIGMEDYFFILMLFHYRYNDPPDMVQATFDGLCYLFFDAIYDEGRIQKIHELVNASTKEKLHHLFDQFDTIFTVNYDCNVEMIAEKPIYYLHGDFNTLHDQYNPGSLLGRMYFERGTQNPVTEKTKHIYCNGIMGFSGSFKEKIMDIFENGQFGVEQLLQKINTGLSSVDEEKLEEMRILQDDKLRFAYDLIQTKKNHTDLYFHQYPSNIFKNISGEMSIVGLSPNNDEHIWKMLQKNTRLQRIIYYYKSEQDKLSVEDLYREMDIITIPVEMFWKTGNI